MIRPLGDWLLIELEEEPNKIGSFFVPDTDALKYCARCHNWMEALDEKKPCTGVDQFERDYLRDRINFVGMDYSHDVQYVKQPVIFSRVRFGAVLLTGPRVADVHVGDRIVIDRLAGGTEDAVRRVRESEVLATVEA